jgi:hypothetical protein
MTDIPDDLVSGGIEYRMESDRELDDAEAGANVSTCARADLDEARPHLFGECAQLVPRHRLEVSWRIDTIEN